MKRNVLTILVMLLMTIIEGLFLYFAYKDLSSRYYIDAGLTFRDILPYEIVVYVFSMVATLLVSRTTNKKHYVLANKHYIVYLLVMFYLISFRFVTLGNFINGIVFMIYNNYLRITYKEPIEKVKS